jgi:protease-4
MLHRILYVAVATLLAWPAGAFADDEKTATVAHIKLSGSMNEAAPAAEPLFGGGSENFKAKLDRIKKARNDAAVKAIYFEIDDLSIGWSKLDDLCNAIAECRKAGKKTFAYLEETGMKEFVLARCCDEVCVPEGAWLMILGLRLEMMFYKEALDKLGIHADFLKTGDFKAAAEPFTETKMSEANRKQWNALLDEFFDHGVVERIARSKPNLTPEIVKKAIDQAPISPKAALKLGLIDKVAYRDDFEAGFKKALEADATKIVRNYGKAKKEELDLSNPFALLKLLAPTKSSGSNKPKVAVVYATGAIVTGKSGFSLLGGETCGSTTICEAIRQAEEDKTVQAIVLRVDSPGGSALASDLIWAEIQRCKKPVVASMSDVAASGGYYISVGAKRIYAEPGTITGSIGVIGGKLVTGGAYKSIGLNTESLTRGTNAGVFSGTKPFSDTEKAAFAKLMGETYDLFLDKVAEGRKKAGATITRDEVKALAGGRVWVGRAALANKLVDELGSLDDAVAGAWKMAGQPADKEPEILQLPKSKGALDALLDMAGDTKLDEAATFGALLKQFPEASRLLRPVGVLLELRNEPVWMLMPQAFEVK